VCTINSLKTIHRLEHKYPLYKRRAPRVGHEPEPLEDASDDSDDGAPPSSAAPKRRPPLPPGPVQPADLHNYGQVCFKQRGKSEIMLDNGHVVPYNPFLTEKYQTHINVEYCLGTACVSYALKYIMKGMCRAHNSHTPTYALNVAINENFRTHAGIRDDRGS
jgi:hypothetical protein